MTQTDKAPRRWRQTLDTINEAAARGLSITTQIAARPVGLLLGLELSRNPFQTHPSYRAIAHLPLAERLDASAPAGSARGDPERDGDRDRRSAVLPAELRQDVSARQSARTTNSRRRMRSARRPAARAGSRKNSPMRRC